jgi:parallel beta-helix repeat protein
MKILLTAFLFLLLLTPYGLSKEWEVPGECPTIQAALDSCMIGDTVLVSPGVYYENLNWPDTGEIKLLSNNGPQSTIIDANDSGYVVTISSGIDTTTVISGFTIRKGGKEWFSHDGGGIYLHHSSPTIIDNVIIDNIGGGISCSGSSSPIIKSNIIDRNNSLGPRPGSGTAGGIYCDTASTAIIIDNIISNNSLQWAPWGGGAGGIQINSNLKVVVSWNSIINNISHIGSGGIGCSNSSPVISDNFIIGNTSIGGYGVGGGIHCSYSSPHIIRNVLTHNSSLDGAINCSDTSSPNIDSCIIIDNNSDGIYCSFGSNPQIYYNDIFNNTGYGLMNMDSTVIVNADSNWWGHPSGPGGVGPGSGDEVSEWVDYEPWLTARAVPVELASFTATTHSGKVILNWSTATEINNLGFEIERKIINNTEMEWVRIGFKEGHCTTTERQNYQFIDDISSITANSLTYRLKQIDFDGSFEYSNEVFVDNPAPLNFALHQNFPNPYKRQ